jgi:hypothetical protein
MVWYGSVWFYLFLPCSLLKRIPFLRDKMKKILFLLSMILLFPCIAHAQTWYQVPIVVGTQTQAGIGGEGFQMIFDCKFAPSNGNIVYKVTDTNGVWKSIDAGASWNPKFNGFRFVGGASIGINPTDPNLVLIAGSHMYNATPGSTMESGISKSTDGGTTWTTATSTTHANGSMFLRNNTYKGNSLFAFVSGSTTVYCGTHGKGLLKSTDSGSTWSVLVPHSVTGIIYDIDLRGTGANANKIVIAADTPNLVQYTDDGSPYSTSNITSIITGQPVHVEVNQSDTDIIYASNGTTLYKSTATATPVFIAISSSGAGDMPEAVNAAASISSVSLHKADPTKLYVDWTDGTSPLEYYYYSTDSGGSFTKGATGSWDTNGYVRLTEFRGGVARPYYCDIAGRSGGCTLATHPSNSSIILAENGLEQTLKSTDGGVTFTYSNHGYTGAAANLTVGESSIAFLPGSSTVLKGLSDFGLWLSRDNQATWTRLEDPATGYDNVHAIAIEPTLSGTPVLVGAFSDTQSGTGTIFVSTNFGTSWTKHPGIYYKISSNGYQYIDFNQDDTNYIYAGQYRSTNKGVSFGTMTNTIEEVWDGHGSTVYKILGSGTTSQVQKSTNGTATTPTYSGVGTFFPKGWQASRRFAVDPTDSDRIYVPGGTSGVYIVTPAGGYELKGAADGLSVDGTNNYNYAQCVTDPNNPNNVYVSYSYPGNKYRSSGVFRSINKGVAWSSITSGTGLSNIDPNQIYVNPNTSALHIHGFCGEFKYSTTEVVPHLQTIALRSLDTITIDGQPNEGAWNGANSITLAESIDGTPTVASLVTAKTLWNVSGGTTTIYVLVDGNDANKRNDSVNQWDDTSAELYFDGGLERTATYDTNDTQFVFSWGDSQSGLYVNPASDGTTTGVTVAYGAGAGNHWYAEFKIVTSNFHPSLGTSSVLGFDVFYDEDSNGGTREGQVGWNGDNNNYQNALNFGTLVLGTETSGGGAMAPTVVTGTVTAIGTDTATVYGTITANDLNTDAWFRYGTTSGSLGSTTTTSAFTGSTPGELTKVLAGLTNNTLYYYQAVGSSSAGLSYGAENTFTTNVYDVELVSAPTVLTLAATSVGSQSATLSATVDDGATKTTKQFPWGLTSSYTGTASGSSGNTSTAHHTGVSDGLVFHAQLDQIIGAHGVYDSSSCGIYGTRTGAVLAAGKIGNALSFDGVDDSVTFGDPTDGHLDFGTSSCSLSLFCKPTSLVGTKYILGKTTSTPRIGYSLFRNATGVLTWQFGYGSSTPSYQYGGGTIGTETWGHTVLAVDASALPTVVMRTYLNGSQIGTSTLSNVVGTQTSSNTDVLSFGGGNLGSPYHGCVDDIRIYNRVLSQAEIIQIYAEGSNTVSAKLTGLSEGTRYVYKSTAANGSGTVNGSELSFTTTDVTLPTGTITINDGAAGINSGSATVLMEALDNVGITAYSLAATSTTPAVGSWTTVATTTTFNSAVGFNLSISEGTKQVWGWFKDGWGNTSTVSTDTIIMDTTDPTIMITSPTMASTYNAGANSVTLGGTATDSGSGLLSIDWTNSTTGGTGTASGTSTWTATSIQLNTGVNTLTLVATDGAGNVGSDVINVTGGYSVEQVTGFSKPLSMSIVYSTQFQQGLRNYGVRFNTTWRSTADILRLIANPDNEITDAIDDQ